MSEGPIRESTRMKVGSKLIALRFGLVGCGRIGATADDRTRKWPKDMQAAWLPYAHATGILGTTGLVLAAVCDVDATAAEAAKARFGAPKAYTDHREMFVAEKLDGVAIATRTAARPGIVRDAVEQGVRAIYCEKPLATTLESADAVASLVRQKAVAFGYGTRRRHMEAYVRARALVKGGAIGLLRTIVVKFGRGALMWNHPHSVDIASFFADDAPIANVQANLDLLGAEMTSLEDGAKLDLDPIVESAHIRFANGLEALIVGADGQDVELVGSTGVLTVRQDGLALGWRRLAKEGDIGWLLDEKVDPIAGDTSGTVRGLERLVRAVGLGAPDHAELDAALASHEVLFGFVESHFQSGARVPLPLRRRGIEITGRVGEKLC